MAISVWFIHGDEYAVEIDGKDKLRLNAIGIVRNTVGTSALATVIDRGLVELDAEGRPAEELGPSEDEPERRK